MRTWCRALENVDIYGYAGIEAVYCYGDGTREAQEPPTIVDNSLKNYVLNQN